MNMATPPDLDNAPLELLIKVMKMTSAEDNIALVAIRKANAHLAKMGTDWEAVLRGKVKIIADPFASINIPQAHVNPNRNQAYSPPPPAKPQAPHPPNYNPAPAPQAPRRSRPAAAPLADPGPNNGSLERTIVNKHDGTCINCKNKVLAGEGFAEQWKRSDGKTKWTTKHSGPCPSARKFKPATTSDDFQV